MKVLIALLLGLVSIQASADLLTCTSKKGYVLELNSHEPWGEDSYVVISTWSKEGAKAKFPDLYHNGTEANSVKQLLDSTSTIVDERNGREIKIEITRKAGSKFWLTFETISQRRVDRDSLYCSYYP